MHHLQLLRRSATLGSQGLVGFWTLSRWIFGSLFKVQCSDLDAVSRSKLYPIGSFKTAFPAFCVTWKLMVNPVSTKSVFAGLLSLSCELDYVQIVNLTTLRSDKNWDLVLPQLEITHAKWQRSTFAFQLIKLTSVYQTHKCYAVNNTAALWHGKCSLCS